MYVPIRLGKPVLLLASLFTSLFLVGCLALPVVFLAHNDEQVQSYLDVQKAYASALERAIGNPDRSFRIVPVKLAAYPLGSVLKPDSEVDPVTSECRAGAAQLPAQEDQLVNFPTISTSRTFSLGGGVSKDLANAINDAVNVGANVTKSEKLSLGYEGGKREIIPANDVSQFIQNNAKCARAIAGQRVLFVRGQIFTKMAVTSEANLELGANAKAATRGNFEIKWDNKGGFELKDTNAVPRFLIVSELVVKETEQLPHVDHAKSDKTATAKVNKGVLASEIGGGVHSEVEAPSRYSATVVRPSDDMLDRLR